MNKSSIGGGEGELIAARKKALGLMMHNNNKREKDEDLHLFREMHKREKDRGVSLLQLVSEEFEANGQNSIYGMAPGKFLSETGKNDYDWLKTPPATPLFPSLEMESKNAPQLAVQVELPIIQSLAKLTEGAKSVTERSKSPISKPKVFPRYSTPSSRLSTSTIIAEKKNIKSAPITNHKMNQSYSEHTVETPKKTSVSVTPKPIEKKQYPQFNMNILSSNFNKSMGLDSRTKVVSKPQNREFSAPFIRRQTVPTQHPDFSDETPPNLRSDRSLSVSRVRSSTTTQTPTFTRTRLEPIMQSSTRTVSTSPNVSRGRKQETEKKNNSQKDKTQQGNNRTQVLGSKMVDRVLNARMSNADEKQSKSKLNTSVLEGLDSRRSSIDGGRTRQSKTNFNSSVNETASGLGKFMSRSSLDMALKHMDVKRDSSVSARKEFIGGRRSVSVMKGTSS